MTVDSMSNDHNFAFSRFQHGFTSDVDSYRREKRTAACVATSHLLPMIVYVLVEHSNVTASDTPQV